MSQQPDPTAPNDAASATESDRREETVSFDGVHSASSSDQATRADREESTLEAEDGPEAHPAATDRCDTCGTTIGPRAYRLSRVVEDGLVTHETHYCSEDCFPDESLESNSNASVNANADTDADADGDADVRESPQDWSYCR